MADLSLLFTRKTARFAPDRRFDAAEPDADPAPPLPASPVADPLADAHEAGFARGYATARDEAQAQVETAAATRAKLQFTLARLDTEQTETLRQRLLDTVVALCEATLAPLALDRAALASRVERAAAMFARADDERLIRLHPDDLTAVQAMLPPEWDFLADPALERGALRIETRSGGAEDGPAQWRQAIREALDLC